MTNRLLAGASLLATVFMTNPASAAYLVYDPGGLAMENHVQSAMTTLGYSYNVRDASNPVTVADLASHQALVIGWTVSGDYSGLDPSVLAAGITGNRIITGHDADYHTWAGVSAAQTLMDRYVLFAGSSPGYTGLVAFPDWVNPSFSYMPSAWGIAATGGLQSETITSITADGLASGLYSGLTTADLSNWAYSYHAYFTAFDSTLFKSFEVGSEGYPVTIGYTVRQIHVPEPDELALLGVGLLGLVAARRRANKA